MGTDAQMALTGMMSVSATADNTATASVIGVAGSAFGGIAVMLSRASVGAGTKAGMDGDVSGATGVTVLADGTNKADSETIAVAVGAFAGAGTGSIAEVTEDADVVSSVSSAGSVGTTGGILVKAVGDNDAVTQSDGGTGSLIGITGSAISAKVGGAVQTLLTGT